MARIYISGPMSGYEDHNRDAFYEAERALNRLGAYYVVNPHTLHGGVEDKSRASYMRADLAELDTCEYIYMLPGWECSRGARCEWMVAYELGLVAKYHEDAAQFAVDDLPSIDQCLQARNSNRPEEVLTVNGEASRIVYGQREEHYDNPLDNFSQIAEMLSALWKRKLLEPITAHDIAPMMIVTKLSRHSHSWLFDNLVDIAGYAETDLRVKLEREKRANASHIEG